MESSINTKKKKKWLTHAQLVAIFLVIYDIIVVNAAYMGALWLRFDLKYSEIPTAFRMAYLHFAPFYTIICILIFWALKLYRSVWRFASFNELLRSTIANILTFIVQVVGITVFFQRMPLSYYIFGVVIQFVLVVAIRFSYRFVLLLRSIRGGEKAGSTERIMVIGAGAGGRAIIRELGMSSRTLGKVTCIIDDNPNKWNRTIDGIPIVGGRNSIPEMVEKYGITSIYFAIPTASGKVRKEILDICSKTDCHLKSLPGIYQLINGEVSVSQLKDVAIEDLLGREQINLYKAETFDFIKGRTILVTGGGGSIGSELCRQIAAHGPKRLIIVDIYENNAYSIQLELIKKYPDLDLRVHIGSVRDSRFLLYIFHKYQPQVVYHAAAHKHVPLMEDAPNEAIKNNTIGTYKTALAAMANGCEKFVLISTDKAVNPTNVMGASKRLCEKVIQSLDYVVKNGKAGEIPTLYTHEGADPMRSEAVKTCLAGAKTEFVAVRFGNVLGSNGSVIPLFKKQIAEGGPVTVTDPNIIRYFMTIPEAVSLVLEAGIYAKGGEIMVLDMGEPVKIDDMARNLIRLSGLKPDVDIKIVYTGLRPGEKLYEERLMDEEGLKKTENDLINVARPLDFDYQDFLLKLEDLMKAAYENRADIRVRIKAMVPTYKPADNK